MEGSWVKEDNLAKQLVGKAAASEAGTWICLMGSAMCLKIDMLNLCVHVRIRGNDINLVKRIFNLMNVDLQMFGLLFNRAQGFQSILCFVIPFATNRIHMHPLPPVSTEIAASWGCCAGPALEQRNFQKCLGRLCFLVYKWLSV